MQKTKTIRVPKCQKCRKRFAWAKLHPTTFLCEACQIQRWNWAEKGLCPNCGGIIESRYVLNSREFEAVCTKCEWNEFNSVKIVRQMYRKKKKKPVLRLKNKSAIIDDKGLLALIKGK